MIINLITLFTTNIVTNMIMIDFFSAKYQQKHEKVSKFLLICVFTTIATIINLLNNPTYNLFTYIGLFLSLNLFFYKLKSSKDILINISFFLIIFLLLDTLCHTIVEIIVRVKITLSDSFIVLQLKMIISSLVRYTVYNFMKNFILRKEVNTLSKGNLISYISVSFFSFTICGMFAVFINESTDGIKLLFFVLTVGVIAFNIWYLKTLESLSQKDELEKSIISMEEKTRMLVEYYQHLEEKEEQSRLILHDINNHLQMLEKNYQNNDSDYFNEVKDKMKSLTSRLITNRRILNILFLEKIDIANKYNIKIIFDIDPIDLAFIGDFDIITIFSNIMDNAIECVKELDLSDRKVTLRIKKVKDFIIIDEVNPCNSVLTKKGDKILTSKKGHAGLGLQSISKVLKKYDANMVVAIDEKQIFHNTIMFTL